MLILSVAAAKTLAVEASKYIQPNCLPCLFLLACLVGLSVWLVGLPACLVCAHSNTLVLLKCIFCELICLVRSIFLDIYGKNINLASTFYQTLHHQCFDIF
jgi:hypothetical protein